MSTAPDTDTGFVSDVDREQLMNNLLDRSKRGRYQISTAFPLSRSIPAAMCAHERDVVLDEVMRLALAAASATRDRDAALAKLAEIGKLLG